MVTNTPIRPIPFLILYLDKGRKDYAGKSIDFRNIQYTAKVLSFGTVERSIPYPSGLISIPDCTVEVEDTDGSIRGWFDDRTPLRRIGEIAFEFESNAIANDDNLDGPLLNPFDNQDGPSSDYNYSPFFTGEIVGVDFPVGMVRITLRSTTSSWMDRMIPFLGVRDHFPNMPDDIESIFIPIILGRVESPTETNVEKQGVIKAHHIDTTLKRYVVARHSCFEVIAAYRKKPHDDRYFLVSGAEYTVVEEDKVINGITYSFTYVQFINPQEDGTEIHVDVSGCDFRYDFDSDTVVSGAEVRDPVDSIMNLIFFNLLDEVNLQRYDNDSFLETRTRTVARGYKCDGAITDQMSNGLAISRVCGDFLIDFAQTNRGEIKLHLYDAALDADSVIPLDDGMILVKSLHPTVPADKIKNRILYRYNRQNAGLVEFRRGTNSGNWLSEYTVDNLLDQAELAAMGANPLLELQWELGFVRDDDTARAVIRDRLGYHTLRSYTTDLDLSGPRVIDFIHLSDPVAVTEIWGIGPPHSSPSAGWVDKVLRIYGIVFDLRSLECKVSAVVPVVLDDADLEWSFDTSHPAHDAQVRFPHLTTQVNGSVDPSDPTRVYPDADQTLNIEDSLIEVVTAGISFPTIGTDPLVFNFSPVGPSASVPDPVEVDVDTQVAWSGIHWEEDVTTKPRSVKGYVPFPFFTATGKRYVGTLSPDTKPTGLTEEDAGKVVFYSVDFDREYLWIGLTNPLGFPALPGETFGPGNTTGWRGIDYDRGKVSMFKYAPITPGWQICDGSSVLASTANGITNTLSVDDLNDGDRFPRFTAAHEATSNPNCNAVAPTISGGSFGSGTALSDGAHTHGVSGTLGPDGTHGHNLSTSSTGAHTHTGGTTSSDGAHVHTGSTVSSESAHTHGVSGNTESGGTHTHDISASSAGSHTHGLSLSTSSDGDHTHTPSLDFDTVANAIPAVSVVIGFDLSYDGSHTHDVSGSTASDGSHGHSISFDSGMDGSHLHDIDLATGAGSSHTHTPSIASDGAHTHTLGSTSSDGGHVHDVIQDAGNDGSHQHDVNLTTNSQGAHTHTVTGTVSAITAGTQGRPKSVGLMPYMRL